MYEINWTVIAKIDWSSIAIVIATFAGPIVAVWASDRRTEHRYIRERREAQLRQITKIRTKIDLGKSKWQARNTSIAISQQELDSTPYSKPIQLNINPESTLPGIEKLEEMLNSMFYRALKPPFLIPMGMLDELEYIVDSTIVVVDATNEQNSAQQELLLQHIKRYRDFLALHPEVKLSPAEI